MRKKYFPSEGPRSSLNLIFKAIISHSQFCLSGLILRSGVTGRGVDEGIAAEKERRGTGERDGKEMLSARTPHSACK